ncbi:MAG: hypothetical protein L6R37_007913 [Teloschistes peruensis]|nr:MAG: hypothetical protein L6R37_007913 [Teloschistes peruensis]
MVQGQGFSAVTPRICVSSGHSYQGWASFLVNFTPIFCEAVFGVAVTCGFSYDIGLIQIKIHADISALLNLSSLPFSSVVYVNLETHNFPIYFGE